jgi:sodium pump decarboxylase gamma subunit
MYDKWMILLAGMGTVFVTLILIIAMLSLFKVVFGGRAEKKRASPAPLPEINRQNTKPAEPAEASPRAANEPLVAAITAAIAAATGASPSSFRIASILPAVEQEGSFNTPVWGRVERFSRQ